jgi:imidazole glycerol-phosphate synthase subunit HisF
MTLTRRIIVCLDVDGGRVVKGTRFVALRDMGEPAALAERYEAGGADEIVFLDISASAERRALSLDAVRRTAERLFIPLTVGGGIRSVDDAERALRAGADKVSVNSAAIETPTLLTKLAERFGRQCVVASIDAKRSNDSWTVYSHGGRTPTSLDAVEWAKRCTELGAGEIMVTSIDRDGTREGYDLELTSDVVRAVRVPVIASGGAGSAADVTAVLSRSRADAALLAGILHSGETTVDRVKADVARAGLPVRAA